MVRGVGRVVRRTRVTLYLAVAVVLCAVSFQASASRVAIDIAQKSADKALVEFARQTGVSVLFPTEHINQIVTNAVRGTYEVEEALAILLRSTGLTAELGKSGVLTVKVTDELGSSIMSANKNRSRMPSFLTSLAAILVGSGHAAHAEESQIDSGKLEEIVVTAEKRSERLQDVPAAVTAISSDTLLANNQTRIQDYFATVPGLNFAADNRGNANLSIRGITTGAGVGNPTVGIAIDDVPFGPSSSYGAGGVTIVPDIDPSQLQRVEVLRGPQGTLYGASSIGGLVKFVTADPSMDAISGRVQVDGDSVRNGNGLGFGVRGSVNVPLTDTLAMQASGFQRRDPGYIDNVLTGQKGVNRVDASGGRLSVLWRPSDRVSLKVGALLQDTQSFGSPYADPSLGDLKQSNIPNTGDSHEQTELFTATLTAKLNSLELTSVSGYGIFKLSASEDFTPYFSSFLPSVFGVSGTRDLDDGSTYKFTQEIRLSGSVGQRFDWLAGVFYTHEDTHYHQQWFAEDTSTGALATAPYGGNFLDGTWPTTYAEYAGFTDLTLHFTERFDIQLGGRESFNKQSYSEVDGGGYGPVFFGSPNALVTPQVDTKDNSFTYLVTPRLRISSNLMAYIRFASGYRPGGPNSTCVPFDVPCHFNPDKTQNYELGLKGQLFDHRLSFAASVYYIDWKNIQLQVLPPSNATEYFTNAGGAKSQGIELSANAKPFRGLSIDASFAWNDAVLTEGFPSTSPSYGVPGNRLPNSARLSGSLSIEQQFPVVGQLRGFVGASTSYVGDRLGVFQATPTRQDLPAYAQTDVRSGVRQDDWEVNAAVTNLADKRGELAVSPVYTQSFFYIQPRTIHLSVSRSF